MKPTEKEIDKDYGIILKKFEAFEKKNGVEATHKVMNVLKHFTNRNIHQEAKKMKMKINTLNYSEWEKAMERLEKKDFLKEVIKKFDEITKEA